MRVIRFSTLKWQPWKDGGGQTATLASFPEGSGPAGFLWRISIAKVERDGPFSKFANVDRALTVLEGNGLALSFESAAEKQLNAGDTPLFFSGDVACSAKLRDGPIMDFNVMTQRGQFVSSVTPRASHLPPSTADKRFVLALESSDTGLALRFDLIELAPGDERDVPAGLHWLDVEIKAIRTMQ